VSAASRHQEEALNLVGIMLSEEYQTILGETGLTPARLSLADLLGDDEFARAASRRGGRGQADAVGAGLAGVEGSRTMEDLFVGLATGGDPAELARRADEAIDAALARG
jgi:N,N'-diacetylchitobiose transport system substrate-binding protein